jgi:hypothetical protein
VLIVADAKVLAFDVAENSGAKGYAVMPHPNFESFGALLGQNQSSWHYYDIISEGEPTPFLGDIDISWTTNPMRVNLRERMEVSPVLFRF